MRKSLLLALLIQAILDPLGSLHAQTSLALLVRQGEIAPGTQGGTYSRFGFVSLNDHGQIAFEAAIENSDVKEGLFLYSNGRVTPVALWGETAPGTEGGRFAGIIFPQLNNRGEIPFRAGIQGSPLFHSHGLFLFSGGKVSAVALREQPIPGMNARFGNIRNVSCLNDSGMIAFGAEVFPEEGNQAWMIFLRSGDIVTPAVTSNDRLFALNNAGNILFASDFVAITRVMPEAAGLSLKAGDTIRELFDSSFGYLIQGASLNNRDEVVFAGFRSDRQAVFRIQNSGPVEVVGPDSPPFAGSRNVSFSSPIVNDQGVLSFIGKTITAAIYLMFEDGEILRAVSEAGIGSTSGNVSELIGYVMNNNNHLAVIARTLLPDSPEAILLASFGGSETLQFAHFADGSDDFGNRVASRITLVNPSSTQVVTGKIEILGDDGHPLNVDLNRETTSGRRSFTITPSGSTVFLTDGLGEVQQGSVKVSADGLLAGFILFEGSAIGAAGLESSLPMQAFLAPVETDTAGGISTGVAVMNLEAEEKTLQAELRDLEGNLVATGLVTRASDPRPLAASGHLALFLEEFQWDGAAPDLSRFQGHLKVTASSGQIATLVLRLDLKTRQLASLPVAAAR